MKREKREIVYSIAVLVAVPLLVIVNTLLLVRSTSAALNGELRREASVTNSVIAQSSLSYLQEKNYDLLSAYLNKLEKSEPTLMHTMVILDGVDGLKIIARSDSAPSKLTTVFETTAELTASRKMPIAALVNTFDRNKNQAQAWNVMTPIVDSNGDRVFGFISSSILTTEAQMEIDKIYLRAFIILAASVLLIFGLLFRYFRLVGYIQLLAKQRELNQTMSDFLSVATHELKAPTSIIKGYLSNVMDGVAGPIGADVKKQLEVAMAQTERLNDLVKDLLNVSRVDQGRIEYNFVPVDTVKIISLIVDNYRPIAAEKGLKLIYEPVEGLPMVRADEGRVQEIFTNLIDNAIKYTAEGSVTITQRIEQDKLSTSIRDTGFGMSPEAKQRLFQRFYRVQTAQTQNISGTGLGLWIIKQYATAMKGSIDVESMEGVGSNFIVKLAIDNSTK